MQRLLNAVINWAIGFAVAFGIGSVVRDRKTGVRAGVVFGTISAALAWVAYGNLEEAGVFEDLEDEDDEFASIDVIE